MTRLRLFLVVVGMLAIALGFSGLTGSASADSMLTMSSYTDPRGDMAARPGTLRRGLYGPITVAGNGQYHPLFPSSAAAPCSNCRITDVIPNLVTVDASCDGNNEPTCPSANLGTNGVMLHHFVFFNQAERDLVCPTGLAGSIGERFMAAGNERTHMHLPSPYGYQNDPSSWQLLSHLVNKSASSRTVYIEVVYRFRTDLAATKAARPAWLDIDGCGTALPSGDSEYSIPTGYTDYHDADNVPDNFPDTPARYGADWTMPFDARVIGISGHSHDVDINGGVFCTPHCPAQGGGIAVSAEVLGGSGSTYYGPSPPNNPRPSDLTGATLCRSEAYYGTPFSGGSAGAWNGHLDTMSQCGTWSDLPGTAQAESYPVNGQYSLGGSGYPVAQGQTIRLHSEYQNGTGLQQNDVMGIMVAWLDTSYARPNGAAKVRVTLVPAFDKCTAPNTSHGTPLDKQSCSNTGLASDFLTVPNDDSTRANGSVTLKLVCTNGETPPCPAAGEQENVNFNITVNDVRSNGVGTPDYGGQLQAQFGLRITDKDSGASEDATMVEHTLNVTVPCTTNSDPTLGSACSVVTNANAISAGMVKENKRAIWALDDVKVFDGGSDGVASTTPNTLFARQGIFVP